MKEKTLCPHVIDGFTEAAGGKCWACYQRARRKLAPRKTAGACKDGRRYHSFAGSAIRMCSYCHQLEVFTRNKKAKIPK